MEIVKNEPVKAGTDIGIMIATGNSRLSTNWKNREITWQNLLEQLSTTTRTRESSAEYRKMAKSDRDQTKDVGGFVGGTLKNGRRKAENVANRTVVTLDLDNVSTTVNDVWGTVTMFFGEYELCMYSTHSHTPKNPRLRLVIPLNRPVFPDEYQAISRRIASDIGIDWFDDTTYEPSRLMFWPSTSSDGEYVFRHQTSDRILNADEVLNRYQNWKDVSQWPVSSRQNAAFEREMKKQEDPLEKTGIIGAFCRTYTIEEAIDRYLSDVYLPTNMPGRYTYAEGSTTAGLVVYDGKFAYSHHSTDPTSGELCNAFDLVRIHLYGLMDEDAKEGTPVNRLPSFTKMTRVAVDDPNVKKQLGLEKLKEIDDDFEFGEEETVEEEDLKWLEDLDYDKKGNIINSIENTMTVLANDARVKDKLIYDSFANRAIVAGKVPWNRGSATPSHDWSDTDDSGLRHFLEKSYALTTVSKIDDAKNLTFDRNKFHPVRDYLNGLKWDGKKRVETVFIDYLGAEDTIYTRSVAIIHLVGAVSRVFHPGIKYDTMVTLAGPQGIGKSTFICKLAKEWYSESLDTVKGKEAAELIQGVWHVEMGELNATRKADRDSIKAFLSRRFDIYRVAYAKNTTRFPRQCVFWGTTNESNFLRDPTGDRRTYPIDCYITKPKKSIFEDMTEYEIDQIWAEAVELYKDNTPIILTGEALKIAEVKQAEHKEDVPLTGLIEQYVEKLLPKSWNTMELSERQAYLNGNEEMFIEPAGELDPHTANELLEKGELIRRDRVCVMEIWCELLGKKPADLKPINSREINDILRSLSGWNPAKGKLSFGNIYGKQRGFIRDLI